MLRMLIVDDEERIVNSLYGYLSEALELEIYRAYSAERAMALLETMRFDLVLTDIAMPGMNGIELMKRIKAEWPFCRVIILTAHGEFDYTYQALQYDHVDYLLKIEDYETILKTVQKNIASIQAENAQEGALLRMSEDLERYADSVTRFIIRREVILGAQPAEETLHDQLPGSIDRQKQTLLAVGRLDVAPADAEARCDAVADYLRRALKGLGLIPFVFAADTHMLWLFQQESGDERRLMAHIREIAEALIHQLEIEGGQTLSLAISEKFSTWENLYAKYRKAMRLLDRMQPGGITLFGCEDDAIENAARPYPSMEELTALWDLVRQGRQEECLALLDAGTSFLSTQAHPCPEAAANLRSALAFLISSAQQSYGENQALFALRERLTRPAPEISGEALRQEARMALLSLFDLRVAVQRGDGQWLVRKIDKFIDAHYPEDISLTTIAEQTHYNPSYISRFYKARTGKNVMTRLFEARISAARQLLSASTLKIPEVAARTGFCSAKYFNQLFRKQTGMTPAEFRAKTM